MTKNMTCLNKGTLVTSSPMPSRTSSYLLTNRMTKIWRLVTNSKMESNVNSINLMKMRNSSERESTTRTRTYRNSNTERQKIILALL
jgi:hypothetical protein